jgi:hypothetical protein
MSERGIQRLIFICVAAAMLMALVAFAKAVLSPMVAAFIAGLGLGAVGVLAVMLAVNRMRGPTRTM